MSYKELTKCTSAFFSSITLRMSASLSAVSFPVYLKSRIRTCSFESSGLSVQIISTKSSSTATLPFFLATISSNVAPQVLFTTRPSKPNVSPSPSVFSIYSSTVGTPSSPILKSVTVLPSSCAAACTKYLPSVQRPASFIVTTATPADPVNPVIYFLAVKCSPTYSDS